MPTPDELLKPDSPDVGGLPISSTLTQTPQLPTPSGGPDTSKMLEGFASALASFGDAFRQFGGKPAVFQKERREREEATRKAEHEKLSLQLEGRKAQAEERKVAVQERTEARLALTAERDYRLRVLDFSRKASVDDVKSVESYFGLAEKLHRQGVDASVIENALTGLADKTGIPFLKDLARDLATDKGLASIAGPAMSILKEDPSGIGGMFLLNARSLRAKDPKAFTTDVAHAAARVAYDTISAKLPGVLDYLKTVKGQQPITTEDVAGFLGQQNSVYGQLIRGAWDAPEDVRTQLGKLLTASGVQTSTLGAKVAERKALIPVTAEEERAKEEATRPGREQFAADVENMKRRIEAGSFPDKKEQAALRNQYRNQARQLVEAQFRGPLGQINLTNDEERAAFEKKIEDKAAQMANDDGIGFIFPGKRSAAPEAAPTGETLSRKDARYRQARTLLKLTDQQIEKKYGVTLTE